MTINADVSKIVSDVFSNSLVSGLSLTRSITLSSIARGTYSPSTGTSTDVVTTFILNAIIREITLEEIQTNNSFNKQYLLEAGDITLSIGRTDPTKTYPTTITTNDKFSLNSVTYNIVDVQEKDLGTDKLMWILIARKA
jgi:hypothetical protein